MTTPAVIAIILIVAITVIPAYFDKVMPERLMRLLLNGNFEEFDRKSESIIARFFIHPYNMFNLKLSEKILQDDSAGVEELLKSIDIEKLNEEQRDFILERACNYYRTKEYKALAEKWYKVVRTIGSQKLQEKIKVVNV